MPQAPERMTGRCLALLRAINLGARNKVAMPALREVFAAAGARDVETYLQSGNVLFAHDAPDAAAFEAAFADAFGFATVVLLRTAEDLRTLLAAAPPAEEAGDSRAVFLARPPDAGRVDALAGADVAPDRFAWAGGDLVVHHPNGFHRARLTVNRIEGLLGVDATLRNWRTVAALAERLGR
jgi:uncharacterized protein (DUF1697 family)